MRGRRSKSENLRLETIANSEWRLSNTSALFLDKRELAKALIIPQLDLEEMAKIGKLNNEEMRDKMNITLGD